jgi:hypothetical protein
MQRRFGDKRPGLRLVAVEDAALPVSMLKADVLAQERKQLPVTEEFILRFVQLGVVSPDEIAKYLGLGAGHVLDAAAAQLAENHLRRRTNGELQLTGQGMEVVRNLVATQPVMQHLPVAFDRLTWSVANYSERTLVEKKDAEDSGMTVLPASRSASIGLGDVTPLGMNALLKKERLQILRVHKVSTRKHRFLPVQLLVYGDIGRNELELAVCIDDDLSPNHGMALERANAVSRLGISIGEVEPRPLLDDDLEDLRLTELDRDASELGLRVSTSDVRGVSVFEHADLLAEALETAASRILIVSPWIRRAVVNADFGAKLERRLRAGVEVTIAHGYGSDDSGSDPAALRRLSVLAGRFSNFHFIRLKNTHAKILIFDGNWVSTSFNWLSFKGDPERTYRMEEGTLVTVPDRVEKEYRRYIELVNDQNAGQS